jgi:hypothetical protein
MSRFGLKATLLAASAVIAGLGATATAQRGNGFPAGTITLFDRKGFAGEAITVDGPVEKLNAARFNDRASSAELTGIWELCDDSFFRGRCEVIDFSLRDLGAVGLNNNISSLRPVGPRELRRQEGTGRGGRGRLGGGGDIVLFTGLGFTGEALPLNRGLADLSVLDFNDRALSVRVNRGEWVICEDARLDGRCEVITADVRDLGRFNLNRRLSSIEPYTGQAYGPQSGPVYGGGYGSNRGGHGRSPGYGSAQPYAQALEGVDTVFFTDVRDEFGQQIRARGFADDRFCQALGLRDAEYSSRRNGFLTDVLCEK